MKTLKNLGVMTLFALCALGIATNAFTQPGMDGQQPGQPGQPNMMPPKPPLQRVMHAGASGLFILDGITMTKYDAATLKQLGDIKLLGTAADKPDANQDNAGRPPMGPPPAGAFLVASVDNKECLLVVVGDQFIRITANDFKVAVKQTLPTVQMEQPPMGPPNGPDGQGGPAANAGRTGGAIEKTFAAGPGGNNGPGRRGMGAPGGMQNGGQGMMMPPLMPPQPPTLELFNNILYVLRGNQLLSIKAATGTILAQGTAAGRLMGGQPQ